MIARTLYVVAGFLVLLLYLKISNAARYNVVGSQDQRQEIRLKSQYDMAPGKVLKLPIDVPREYLSLFGTLPPRLVSIKSPNTDGVYGTGDVIEVQLQYTIDVRVSGTPTLAMNTGCTSSSCTTKEVQRFWCAADRGMFAVRLEDQFLMNIPTNTTKEQLKAHLESLEGVELVTISYSEDDDRPYSHGNRVCTSLGNFITVTFDKVSFPQYEGNVPEMHFDATNTFANLRSGLNLGTEDTFLRGVHFNTYTPNISMVATELTQGKQLTNGIAHYTYGNGTNTVSFDFIVRDGDYTERLEVLLLNFESGFIYSPVTGANVSSAVPDALSGPRYMGQAASSLGFNNIISITSAQPQIISVTSPNADGTYTWGDSLSIYIEYDLAVKVFNTHELTLQLSTGAFDRISTFKSLLSGGKILQFEYQVQEGDTANPLEVLTVDSLYLGIDGAIFRDTSTNETTANVTLPFPGAVGSLSYNKNLIINTLSPVIVEITAASSLLDHAVPNGTYTAGDVIDFEVRYGTAVYVTGTPRLLIQNTQKQIDAVIRAAPFQPDLSFRRSKPGAVGVQLVLRFQLNLNLEAGDTIALTLPGFSIMDDSGPSAENNRSMIVELFTDQGSSIVGTGFWSTSDFMLNFTVYDVVWGGDVLNIVVEGRSGLIMPLDGIFNTQSSDFKLSICSSSQVPNCALDSTGFELQSVSSIGLETMELILHSVDAAQSIVRATWQFSLPEPLLVGDTLSIKLSGFDSNTSALMRTISTNDSFSASAYYWPQFNVSWSSSSNTFAITKAVDSADKYFQLNLTDLITLVLPVGGVGSETVRLSADMQRNGVLSNVSLPAVTYLCAFPPGGADGSIISHVSPLPLSNQHASRFPSIRFQTLRPGAASAISVRWITGANPLIVGDQVVIELPPSVSSSITVPLLVSGRYISGDSHSESFTVSIETGTLLIFTASKEILPWSPVDVILSSSVGLVAPEGGLLPGSAFSLRTFSNVCQMIRGQEVKYAYDALIVSITTASLELSRNANNELSLGSSTSITVVLGTEITFERGDSLTLSLPQFFREVTLDPYRHNITSNAMLSARYNRRLSLLELEFEEEFEGSAANLFLVVNESSGYRLPTSSVPYDSFLLNIFTVNSGSLEDFVLSNAPCIGICKALPTYSTVFVGEPLVVTLSMVYSRPLTSGSDRVVLSLGEKFTIDSVTPLSALFARGTDFLNFTTAAITTETDGSHLNISIVVPETLDSYDDWRLEVRGLAFAVFNASVTNVELSDRDTYVYVEDNSIGGGVSYMALSLPTKILARSTFEFSSLRFISPHNTGGGIANASITITLTGLQQLIPISATGTQIMLSAHTNSILIKLPGFYFQTSPRVLVKPNGTIEVGAVSWDGNYLQLPLAKDLNSSASLTLLLENISIPLAGISSNSSESGIAYAISTVYATDAGLVTAISENQQFISVQPVLRLANAEVSYTVRYVPYVQLDRFNASFEVAVGLQPNDVIRLKIPSLVCLDECNMSVSLFAGDIRNPFDGVAKWDAASSDIVINVTETVTATIVQVIVDLATSGLDISSSGFTIYNNMVELSLSNTIQEQATAVALLQCFGICYGELVPEVRKAGFPSEYALDLVFGVVEFSARDVIEIQLEGFERSSFSDEIINVTVNSAVDGLFMPLELRMPTNQSSLFIRYAASRNATLDANFLNLTLPSISLTIPRSFGILSPFRGVRVDGMRYNVSWRSDQRTNGLTSEGFTFLADALSVAPIGKAVRSELTVTPRTPQVDGIELGFSFSFLDPLLMGDVIRIYLPDFTVPDGTLPIDAGQRRQDMFTVVGSSKESLERSNVDGSSYIIEQSARIDILIKDDGGVPANDLFQFQLLNYSGVQLPIVGVQRGTIPWFSVISSSGGPIASTQVVNITRVGSLSPATMIFSDSGGGNTQNTSLNLIPVASNESYFVINATFTVRCPLFSNDSILISVPSLSPVCSNCSITTDEPSVQVMYATSVVSNVDFIARWRNNSQETTIILTVSNGSYVLSGSLEVTIGLYGFVRSDTFVLENDERNRFSLVSELCPVDWMPFEISSPHLISVAALSFDISSAGAGAAVQLEFASTAPLFVGDTIELSLPFFSVECRDNCSGSVYTTDYVNGTMAENSTAWILSLNQMYSSTEVLNSTVIALEVDDVLTLQVFVTANVPTQERVVFATAYDGPCSINFPTQGLNSARDEIQLALLRPLESNATVLERLFTGKLIDVQEIPSFLWKRVEIDSPFRAGNVVSFALEWMLSLSIPSGSKVIFSLPGFTRSTDDEEDTSVVITGPAAEFFSAEWSTLDEEILLTALVQVPGLQVQRAYISSAELIRVPTLGISSARTEQFTVSLLSQNSQLLSIDATIDDVTVIPFFSFSSLVFLSSDEPDALNILGDTNTVQLEPGHHLTLEDSGAQLIIDGDYYTIAALDGDFLHLEEQYTGRRVFLGHPDVPIYTPPYRFATYLSGTNSVSLTFRYIVRKYDESESLALFRPNDDVNSNNITQTLDLNGGQLLRASDSPFLPASITIPSYDEDTDRSVNTDRPEIVAFFTTSPPGVYSKGQQIDFQVRYNYSISVGNLSYSVPHLQLNIYPWGRITAYYSSGSESDTLVFVYNVSRFDDDDEIDHSLLTTSEPIIQPLRIITGYQFNFLRRRSEVPLVNVAVDFGSDVDVSIPNNFSVVGDALKVIEVKVEVDDPSRNLTVGDEVRILVTYDGEVAVRRLSSSIPIPEAENATTSFYPFILIETGRSNPGVAVFSEQSNLTTLQFSYVVVEGDVLSGGLRLTCTCTDYLQRTFIQQSFSNGYFIIMDASSNPVSTILANSSSADELLINKYLNIDDTVPAVIRVFSNVSTANGLPFSPGSIALVSVEFSHPVTVRGILRLYMKAQSAPCPARFFSGNNSNVLNFLYSFSPDSGISLLEYSSIDALDTSDGSIFRLSGNPTIAVDPTLPLLGSEASMGIQSPDTAIDTTRIGISSISLRMGKEESSVDTGAALNHLGSGSVGFNLFHIGQTQECLKQYISTEVQELRGPVSQLYLNSTIASVQANLQTFFGDELLFLLEVWSLSSAGSYSGTMMLSNASAMSPFDYVRLYVNDASVNGFQYIPNLRTLFGRQRIGFQQYWWNTLQVSDFVSLRVNFSRAVTLDQNIFLDLNTDPDNRLLSAAFHNRRGCDVYFLTIFSSQLSDGFEQQSYRFLFNGKQTRCVSVTADAAGSADSIQEILRNLTELKRLEPFVTSVEDGETTDELKRYRFRIEFTHIPDYELKTLTAADLGSGQCNLPAASWQVILQKENSSAVFDYRIRRSGAIVMRVPSGVDETVPPGNYSVLIDEGSRISIDRYGIMANSILFEQFDNFGQLIGVGLVEAAPTIIRVVRSSLSFSSNTPDAPADLRFYICTQPAPQVGDDVVIHLPNFGNNVDSLSNVSTVSRLKNISWNHIAEKLSFQIANESSLSLLHHGVGCLTEIVVDSFQLPNKIILENSRYYTFSLYSKVGSIEWVQFDKITPVGFSQLALHLGDPRPYSSTSVSVEFHIVEGNFGAYTSTGSNESEISVYLPEFFSTNGDSGPLDLIGTSANDFVAEWFNYSSTLIIRSLHKMSAGSYSLTIRDCNHSFIHDFCLHVPRKGIYVDDPPTFSFSAVDWATDRNIIDDFPHIYGYSNAQLVINTSMDTSISILGMEFLVNFSRVVYDDASILLFLPFLSSDVPYLTSKQTSINSSTVKCKAFSPTVQDNDEYTNGQPDVLEWRNAEKSLLMKRKGGWPLGVTSVRVVFPCNSSFPMRINDIGVPADYSSLNLTFAVALDRDLRPTLNGILLPSPIDSVTIIPIIRYSSLSYSTLDTDIFTVDPQVISIKLQLNTPALIGDQFLIFAAGLQPINSTSAVILNATEGVHCYSLNRTEARNDIMYDLFEGYTPESNTTIVINILNGTDCKHDSLEIMLDIAEYERSTDSLYAERAVTQYKTGGFTATWLNRFRSINAQPFDDSPTLVFTHSSIDMQHAYSGQSSPMLIRLLASTSLALGDEIIFHMPGFVMNSSALKEERNQIIEGTYGLIWEMAFDSEESVLTLMCPQTLSSPALSFFFGGDVAPTLPSAGIPVSKNASSDITITVRRPSAAARGSIAAQSVKFVTAVGTIEEFSLLPMRSAYYNDFLSNSFVQAGGTFDTSDYDTLEFKIRLKTLSPLDIGDVLRLEMAHFDFNYDSTVEISGRHANMLRGEIDSVTSSLVIYVVQLEGSSYYSRTLEFNVNPGRAIVVGNGVCNQLEGNCNYVVTVQSLSNPVANASFPAREIFLDVNSTSIRFSETKIELSPTPFPTALPTFAPTPFLSPTSQPSAQPSEQPSNQPSNQPTSVPSGQPSSSPSSIPTFESSPSGQPSSQPSVQPSPLPTCAPSAQPSVQPSEQPYGCPSSQPSSSPTISDQPTKQPTTQPSLQPSGQPTDLPSSQPTAQPSRQPTVQPSSIPTSPTSSPSTQPSNQPSTQPTLQPTSQPSLQPSIQPSTQPSSSPTQPTSQPSCSPSVQPSCQPTNTPTLMPSSLPSSQPTSQPSTQPTSQPTIFVQQYFLFIDLHFRLQSVMATGSNLLVHTPHLCSNVSHIINSSVDIHVVDESVAMSSMWSVRWAEENRTIYLTGLTDIPPDSYHLTVGTTDLTIEQTIIYANDATISYEVEPSGVELFSSQVGNFFNSHGYGLHSANLSFGSVIAGVVTSITISLRSDSEDGFSSTDVINVHLPGFALPQNASNGVFYNVTTGGATRVTWINDSAPTLSIEILDDSTKLLTVVLTEENFVLVPVAGVNNYTGYGLPTLSFTSSVTDRIFQHSPFLYVDQISHRPSVNITFSSRRAGAASDVLIEFGFHQCLALYDYIELRLPQFWVTNEELMLFVDASTVFSTTLNFSASWSACTEILTLVVTSQPLCSLSSSEENSREAISIRISGLRLPIDGVNEFVAGLISLSTNSTRGGRIHIPQSEISVQRVGQILDSRIEFSPDYLFRSASLAISTDLKIWTMFDVPLSRDDAIMVQLPAVQMKSTSPEVRSNCTSDGVNIVDVQFSAEWVASDALILMTPSVYLESEVSCQFNVSGVAALPDAGVFDVRKDSLEYNRDEVNSLTFSIGLRGGNRTHIDLTPVNELRSIGIITSSVHYTIRDSLDDSISFRFQFKPSGPLQSWDTISLFTPLITAGDKFNYSQQLLDGATYGMIDCAGDEIDKSLNSTFECSFSPTTGRFLFTATSNVDSRLINIFVLATSGLRLVSETANLTHFLSANISSVGRIEERPVAHYPKQFFSVRSPTVTITNCTEQPQHKVSVTQMHRMKGCSINMGFELIDTMSAGAVLTMTHPGLQRPLKQLHAFDDLEQILNVSTTGPNGDEYIPFIGYWRGADDIHSLMTHSGATKLYGGDILAAGDVEWYSINMSLPNSLISSPGAGIKILSSIPRIISVYAVPQQSGPLVYTIGDSISFFVDFSDPVSVQHPQNLKLLLSTGEFARFAGGNNTDQLHFEYEIDSPTSSEGIQEISIAGPGALEVALAPGTYVNLFENPDVPVNLTIPSPYTAIGFVDGFFQPLFVNLNFDAPTAMVVMTSAYSKSHSTYGTGDVLDIAVTFDRAVYAEGNVTLALVNTNTSSGLEFIANFVNVSRVQWLEISSLGLMALSYDNQTSSCFIVDEEGTAIVDAVMELAGVSSSIEQAMPFDVVRFSSVIGGDAKYRYKLEFRGVAPGLIGIVSLSQLDLSDCSAAATSSAIAASARIFMDPSLWNIVIFRYVVQEGNNAELVNYNSSTNSLRALPDAAIRQLWSGRAVDHTLPSPDSFESLLFSGIRINTKSPVVLTVSSNFSMTSGPAASGDSVFIIVNYSANIVVPVGTSVFLQLNYSNALRDKEGVRCCVKNVSLSKVEGTFLFFEYLVEMGDYAAPLTTTTLNALIIQDSADKLNSLTPGIFLDSMSRSTAASNILPDAFSENGLNTSQIFIDATRTGPLPRVMNVFSNAGNISSSFNSFSGFNVGQVISITVRFSASIYVVSDSNDALPFVTLERPAGAVMKYAAGSGTTEIVFDYVVAADEQASGVWLRVHLEGGLFKDDFRRTFQNVSDELFILDGLVINTTPAYPLRVDCSNPDGTYYPGDELDVFVVFSEAVYVFRAESDANGISISEDDFDVPQIELFLPSQRGEKLLATYSGGNGTEELHFSYTVAAPNFEGNHQAPFLLDYAGTAAMFAHMNGATITDVSTYPETLVDLFLPNQDHSYLVDERLVYVDFSVPYVNEVRALQPNGVYTAGDVLTISVAFSGPVMVMSTPPVLKLFTAADGMMEAYNRSAVYQSGNGTNTLLFRYLVQVGDKAEHLDYVDTRYAPYSTQDMMFTLALNSEVKLSTDLHLDRSSSIFTLATTLGGVFMKTEDPSHRVQAITALPLPGQNGSLSHSSEIVIDTTAPFVTEVTSPIPNGTYGVNVSLPLTVTFSAPVAIVGCPIILFHIAGEERLAHYTGISGNGQLLNFDFVIEEGDDVINFDYLDRFSLKLHPCNVSQFKDAAEGGSDPVSIKRAAVTPTIDANLTMPWVNYIESVIAPVSITGSGKSINLAGDKGATLRLLWSDLEPHSDLALGDIINVNIGFSLDVTIDGQSTDLYLMMTDYASPSHSRRVFFGKGMNDTTLTFPLIIQHRETLDWLTYANEFSLVTTECAIVATQNQGCIAQNLPPPFNTEPAGSIDALSVKSLRIYRPTITIDSISFVDQSIYYTGSIVRVIVRFTEPIVVIGQPVLHFFLNDEDYILRFLFSSNLDNQSLLFEYYATDATESGLIFCGQESRLELNGGAILRAANFIPLLPAVLKLNSQCCADDVCHVRAHLERRTPVVSRVYSDQNGIFSNGEVIQINVKFSTSVTVIGEPALSLDLPASPNALFLGKISDDTLQFHYVVAGGDQTSSLDYTHVDALRMISYPQNPYSGVYLDSETGVIAANFTLPLRGAYGSLGIENNIIINSDRPNLIKAFALPTAATSGDDVLIVLRYSEQMRAIKLSAGNDLFDEDASTTDSAALLVEIILRPSDVLLPTEIRTAKLVNVSGSDAIFRYQVTGSDPTGSIEFASSAPLLAFDAVLESALTATDGPLVFPENVAGTVLATIDNNIPIVLRVFSPNISSTYPFGVGDVVDIFVEMSLAVTIINVPHLALVLNDGVNAIAQYVGEVNVTTATLTQLHFQYTVEIGDSADPLEYRDKLALTGLLMRFSTSSPSIVANLELPEPFSLGSLGFCCNILIDSTVPYVDFLVPYQLYDCRHYLYQEM